MTSNQRYPTGEVIIPVPGIEQLDFIEEERAILKSALREAKRLQSVLLEAKDQGIGLSQKPKIQRVPAVLKSVKPDFNKCFEPRLVALGPLHHGNPKFELSQQVKLKFPALFADENETNNEALFSKIKAEIDDLKKCYDPDDIKDYNDDKLAWIFFVDGSAMFYAVRYDLLGDLEKLANDPQKWEKSITEFIDENLITNIQSRRAKRRRHTEAAAPEGIQEYSYPRHQQPTKAAAEDYSHLLQRLWAEHLKGPPRRPSRGMIGYILVCCGNKRKNKKTFRSFKELKEAGVYVKPSKSNSLNNISFYCNVLGSLKMPPLMVDDSTEDVKELRGTGMLQNYLGSDEEVARLFNGMSRDLVPDRGLYGEVMEEMQKYCNNRWMPNAVQAYYTHFSNPWTCLGFSVTMMGLLFFVI
ncbi:hypothetical protein DITRI_Ditri06bG0007000 [Diplodiscus trichospermus]